MQAAVIEQTKQPLVIKDVPTPEAGPGEVLLKVEATGFCHSELHMIDADFAAVMPAPMEVPRVPGHEMAGVVAEVGAGVTDLAVGDRIGAHWPSPCGECPFCKAGVETSCVTPPPVRGVPAVGRDGGWAEYMTLPARHAIRIPDGMDLAEATPLLCAGMTVYSGYRRGGLQAGQRAAVVGIGGLGHLAIPIAKAMGAEVVAVTGSADKEALARELGADHVVVNGPTAGDELMGLGGVQFVMYTAPSTAAILPLVGGMLPGTAVSLVGLSLEAVPIPAMAIAGRGLRITGSLGASHAETEEVLALAAEHNIQPMVEQYPLSEVNAVAERLRNNEVRFRAVMMPGS